MFFKAQYYQVPICVNIKYGHKSKISMFCKKIIYLKNDEIASLHSFSNFSCMFLNPNNFFQYEF